MNDQLNADFYNLTQSLWGGFYQATTAARAHAGAEPIAPPPLLQVQAGRAESPGWFLAQAAEFDPEPLTVANLRVRDVYASPRMVAALLEMMAAARWFERRGEAYYLTANGRELIQNRAAEQQKWLALLDQTLRTDLARLENLLGRVIVVALDCETPPGSWCLAHSRHRTPAADASLSAKLLHYAVDINAWRDDAHMAAWQSYDMAGYVWEAFNFAANGQANTGAALFEQLSYRGYAVEEYEAALRGLAERGWLDGQTYELTEQGEAALTAVEQRTDNYFYAPWQEALDPLEIEETRRLIIALNQELEEIKTSEVF